MAHHGHIHPGHGHYPEKRQAPSNGVCPAGTAYYVCAAGPFKGCCSMDPCSIGYCADHPEGPPAWVSCTKSDGQTQTQTQMIDSTDSYTTTFTKTLSPVAGGGTVPSTLSSSSDSPLVSSIMSEMSAISSLTSSHSSGSTVTGSNTHKSSTTSPFLSINTGPPHNGTATASLHGGTIAGITLGTAGAIALLILVCCICCRKRKKKTTTKEDKELKSALKEVAAIEAERNKALRALENRRTGAGVDGAWATSPRYSTAFPGMRRE